MHHRFEQLSSHQLFAREFAFPDTEANYAPDLPLAPEHITIHVRPDLDRQQAAITVTHTLCAMVDGADAITFNGIDFTDLSVKSPEGHDLSWTYCGQRIRVRWSSALRSGDTRKVTLTYTVDRPIAGMVFGGPTPSEPQRGRFVYTDHETERARYWLACVDHPSARTTLDIHLHIDKAHQGVATGALVSTTDNADGSKVVHWHSDARCPSYLLCMLMGDLVQTDAPTVDGIPIAFLGIKPISAENLQRSFGPTGEMISYLTKKLDCPLPWAKYYQFGAPNIGGAMENISLVSWDEMWVLDARAHAERGALVDIINLHEMAHTWFGDLVVVRDYSHAWLKESWATYMESVWLEDTKGEDEQQYHIFDDRRAYREEADNSYVRPIVTRKYDSSWKMYDRHLYPGGAVRLHLLRTMLGDHPFWEGVRNYLQTHAHDVAETQDFRAAMEHSSGRYLARFFDEWIYGRGYPALKASLKHEQGIATISIEQTQVDEKKGIGLFTFPIDIAVETADGQWQHHTLQITQSHHALRLSLTDKPLQVIIDPKANVPHSLVFEPGVEMLKRSLVHAPTVPGRIFAAEGLGKTSKRNAIVAIQDAYSQEPFWGVRVEMARVLGQTKTVDAAQALAALLAVETDPRVVGAVTLAASKHRNEQLASALVRWLDAGPHPYRATASALYALGQQRGAKHIPRLQEALTEHGWLATIARGAAQGLAATKEPEALPILLAVLADPTSPVWLRRVVAGNLPGLAKELELADRRKTREALEDTLQANIYGLRLTAVHALGALSERAAVSALEGAKGQLAHQDHPSVRRAVQSLQRTSKGPAVNKLRRDLEKLSNEVKKLKATLAALQQPID